MGLMARAARMAGRQGREAITEDDIYAAMENKAMEAYAVRASGGLSGGGARRIVQGKLGGGRG